LAWFPAAKNRFALAFAACIRRHVAGSPRARDVSFATRLDDIPAVADS
jgi:hypothetical protein